MPRTRSTIFPGNAKVAEASRLSSSRNQKQDASATLSPAPTGRKTTAQGDTLAPRPPTNPSPEGAAQEWPFVKLADAGVISGGLTKNSKRDSNELQVSYLRVGNVYQNELRLDEIKTIGLTEREFAKTRLEKGDLLIVEGNGSKDQIGRLAIWDGSVEPCVHQNHLIRVRLSERVLPKFAVYWFSSQEGRAGIESVASSTSGLYTLSVSKIGSLELPLPPLPEQRRIVARIEELFSRLDAGVAALRQAKAQLQRYRQSVLAAAVTGQFTTSWRAKNANAESGSDLLKRILKIRRKQHRGNGKYKEPEQKLDIAMLPVIPGGWVWATFEQVSKRVTVGHVGSMKEEYADSGVPFLRGQNIRANRFDPKGLKYVSNEFHAQLNKSRTLPGDIAVTRSGEVGVACVIPDHIGEVNCSDLVLVQQPIEILPEFACYFLNSLGKRLVEKGSVGVAITHFNTQAVAAMPLPLPPAAEQRIIVAEVEARASSIDHIETEIKIKLQHCATLKTAILMAAFSNNL